MISNSHCSCGCHATHLPAPGPGTGNPEAGDPRSPGRKLPHHSSAQTPDHAQNPSRRTLANRANAKKSTGPATPEGKRAVAQNARKHGAFAQVSTILLPSDDAHAFQLLRAAYHTELAPAGQLEHQIVEKPIECEWLHRRLRRAATELLASRIEQVRKSANANRKIALAAESLYDGGRAYDRIQLELERNRRAVAAYHRELAQLRQSRHSTEQSHSILSFDQLALENEAIEPAQTPDPDAQPGPDSANFYPTLPEPAHAPGPGIPAPDTANFYPSTPEALILQPELPAEPENRPEINTIQPSPALPIAQSVSWAQSALQFTADPYQADLLLSQSRQILLCAGRQVGKSTVAAVRILFQAQHLTPGRKILVASPSQAQSDRVLNYVRRMAAIAQIPLAAAGGGQRGIRFPNGSQVLSLPGNPDTIRGYDNAALIVVDEAAFVPRELFNAIQPALSSVDGTLILASTPNGQSGFFFEQWHDESSDWAQLRLPSSLCPRLSPLFLARARRMFGQEVYDQEFECKFLAAPGQPISRELIESALADDCVPFLPYRPEDDAL